MQIAQLYPLPDPPGTLPRFSAVLNGDADAVDALLAAAGPGTRVVRVGNPLRAPLTIERILIQSGQTEAGLLTDDAADQAMHRLCHRRDGESRVLLAIDQAETLSPAALRTLVRIAAPSGPPRPPQVGLQADLHIVFIGTPAFAALLATRGVEPLRDALPHLTVQPGAAPIADPSPVPAVLPEPVGVQLIPAEAPALPAAPVLIAPLPNTPRQNLPLAPAAPAQTAPVQPPAPIMAPPPVPAPAAARHLTMMANVMQPRTVPDGPVQPPVLPLPASTATVVPALAVIPAAPRRGRSRVLVAVLLLAVLGALASVVAIRPDVQERLGIQELVIKAQDALRRLRV